MVVEQEQSRHRVGWQVLLQVFTGACGEGVEGTLEGGSAGSSEGT